MIFLICFLFLWLPVRIFFPIRIYGKKNLPKKGGYVLTCNHTSNWDPIILDIYFNKKFRFLGKKEIFKNKVITYFSKKLGAYPIDREKPELSSIKFGINTLKEGKVLAIFPEGTRNKNFEEKKLLDIKSGAVTFASKGDTFILPMIMLKKVKAFTKNYLIVGEPLKLEGVDTKRLTKEEITHNTERLANEMERLREELNRLVEEKRRKKVGRKQKEKNAK